MMTSKRATRFTDAPYHHVPAKVKSQPCAFVFDWCLLSRIHVRIHMTKPSKLPSDGFASSPRPLLTSARPQRDVHPEHTPNWMLFTLCGILAWRSRMV